MMRKLGVLVFALTFLLIYSSSAQAILTIGSGTNEFLFENVESWENVDGSVDAYGKKTITTGDYFYGIMNVQNQKVNEFDVWGQNLLSTTLDQMSGYFLTEVTGVVPEGATGQVHITLGAYTGVSDPYGVLTDAEIALGGVLKLFSDDVALGGPGTQYTTAAGDPDGLGPLTGTDVDISNATDGSHWATLGVTGNYWYTHAPMVPANLEIGWSWWGLDFLTNNTGGTFNMIDDPDEIEAGILVEMYADSKITNASSPNWDFESDDPAVVVTPEPSSLLLLGSGMVLGAGWLRRRRKKSKA